MGLPDVSTVLWRERELLELLLFKLEEEQLVLTSGRTRWLAHATREVEMVIGQLREAELERAVLVDALAAELGLAPAPSLTALAGAAPSPWDDLLRAHRAAFVIHDSLRRDPTPEVLTADWTYLRFHHGRRGRRGNYSETELREWAAKVSELATRADVYAYFNNDWETFAPPNALRLRALVGRG